MIHFIYIVAEITCFSILGYAVFTGLRTVHRHDSLFKSFSIYSFYVKRLDAMFYLTVIGSTAACTIDIVLRLAWISTFDTHSFDVRWRIMYIVFVHMAFGAISTGIHLLVDQLLGDAKICALCKRPFDETVGQ